MDDLTPDMWERLEKLSKGMQTFDTRRYPDNANSTGYLKLFEMGLCTLVETGPGDSILKFTINDKGRQVLSEKPQTSS